MPDAWRAYLEMALGLTEAPRKRAQKVVGDLTNRGGATAAQLQGLVDDLLSAGVANREALTNIVRHEVDRALGVVGLATAEEVVELTARVRDLERKLRQARAAAADGGAGTEPGAGGTRLEQPAPVPRKVAKTAVAKKAVAKKAVKATPNAMPAAGTNPAAPPSNTARATPDSPPAKATAPAKAAPRTSAPAKVASKAAPAKKAAAKKAVAKKAVAKKAVAQKAAPAPVEPAVPPGTAMAPTAPVKAAAAATELPLEPGPSPASGSGDDAGTVDSTEAGLVDRGEAGLTLVADAAAPEAPARKSAARKAPAKKAVAKNAPAKTTPAKKTAAKKAAPQNPEA